MTARLVLAAAAAATAASIAAADDHSLNNLDNVRQTAPDISDVLLRQRYNDPNADIVPITTAMDCGIDGFSTFQLSLSHAAGSDSHSVYAVFGDHIDHALLPPAFHVPTPLGADIGGVSPVLAAYSPDSAFDSYLTLGLTTGDPHVTLSALGIPWHEWSPRSPVSITNGAVYCVDPVEAPSLEAPVVVAQLTVATGQPATAVLNAQGTTNHNGEVDHTWEARGLQWHLFGEPQPAAVEAAPAAAAPAPADLTGVEYRCSPASLQTEIATIESTCCEDAGTDCSQGPPSTCSPACADLMLGLWNDCASTIETVETAIELQDFMGVCNEQSSQNAPSETAPDVSASLKVMDDVTTNTAGASTASLVSCDYASLTAVAMTCAEEALGPEQLSRDMCSTRCGKALVPFFRGCTSTAWVTAIEGFGLSEVGAMLDETCARETAATCPSSDDLAEVCAAELGPGGLFSMDTDAVCSNPCTMAVQLAQSAHCISSPAGHEVTRLTGVAESTWSSVLSGCISDALPTERPVAPPAADHYAQCSLLSETVLPHMQSVCCAGDSTLAAQVFAGMADGPLCSTTFIDTLTCTDDCANLITAYVQTCADYVTAKGHPQLMDSLLVLGEVCEATVVSGN
jgi:hypothetical protein